LTNTKGLCWKDWDELDYKPNLDERIISKGAWFCRINQNCFSTLRLYRDPIRSTAVLIPLP
jgi:hypothetical protein